jgi:hypothetical protein
MDMRAHMKRFSSEARPAAFLAVLRQVNADLAWIEARDAWPSFDAIPHDAFAAAFADLPPRVSELIDLPDGPITIYRGQDAGGLFGLLWTTDICIAVDFAHGHRGTRHSAPNVYEIKVTAADSAFTCGDRGSRKSF